MTTVRNEEVARWLPALGAQLDRARQMLGEKGLPPPGAADQAHQALRQASETLLALMAEYGLESSVGWQLHELRSRLDAHLLAASQLAEAHASDAVVTVLRRSLDLIDPEVEKLAAYL